MTNPMRWILVLGAALCAPAMSLAQKADVVIPLKNWTVPPFASASGGARPLTHTVGNVPAVFVPYDPCRLHDTRVSAGGAGPIGGSGTGGTRDFDFVPGGCPGGDGIPTNIIAWSLNFTVVGPLGPGFLYAYPTGGTPPPVSIINYNAGELRNNAAIVPVNTTTGSFTVGAGVNGTDVIIDANGIFLATLEDATQFSVTASIGGQGAIRGINSSSTAGSSGVHGLASATSGTVFGVFGKTSSTPVATNASAGVKGVDSGGELSTTVVPASSGVRGDSASGVGVSGFSRTTGVSGSLLNTGGAVVASGYLGYSVGSYGVYAVGDIGATGMKFFVEPHPTDADKVIRFVALEGPEAGTYFRGSSRTVGGSAIIEVPESFRIVTDEENLTVQLTAVGALVSLAVITKDLNQITVRSSRDVAFDYEVKGVRRSFRDHQAIADGYEFMPPSAHARLPAFLSEEARGRLIANGTYREDGSVNLTTADRLGWAAIWNQRAPILVPDASPR